VPGVAQLQVDLARQLTVFFGVSGVEVVEVHQEVGKVGAVFGLHVGDQLFRGDAFLFGAQHDRRTVGVVGADINALVAAHASGSAPTYRSGCIPAYGQGGSNRWRRAGRW
jgi:hypothetical protein